MKKQYLIVGDNNFWYSTIEESTASENGFNHDLAEEIKQVREGIKNNNYDDGAEPSELFVYEITGKYETVKL